jgi:futalosine hydrolase
VRILVVCAVARELGGLARRAEVDVIAVGVGPVEAAYGATRALASGAYDVVINAGIAGGFTGRCSVGDAVVCAREEFIDLGLEDGSPFPLPGGQQLVRAVECDRALLQPFLDGVVPVIVGRGVTSSIVTTTGARAALIAARHNPDVESMEGFAVLRAAQAAGVPAIEIRGVSNVVGDRANNGWNFAAGADAAVGTTDAYLDVLLSMPERTR